MTKTLGGQEPGVKSAGGPLAPWTFWVSAMNALKQKCWIQIPDALWSAKLELADPCVWQTTAPGSICSPHGSAADIQSHMEKYLVDASPPLRLTRPTDYRRDAALDRDEDDDDDGGAGGGRATPAVYPHDVGSLRAAAATLSDVKPFHGLNSDGKQAQSHSSRQIWLPRYLTNGLSNLD